MAGWEDAPVVSSTPTASWESAPEVEPSKAYTSSVLPLSRDAQGNISFDSNAGILGSVKRAFTTPGDVYAGRIDPNSDEALRGAVDLAGLASPLSPARALRMQAPNVAAPSQQELRSGAAAGFNAARDAGVVYDAGAVGQMAAEAQRALELKGLIPETAPKTHAILQRLQNPAEGAVGADITGLHAARRAFGMAGRDFTNPGDQTASRIATQGLDRFITQPDPKSIVAGPAADAGQVWADAVRNYAASKRSEALDDVSEAAALRAKAANSGQNLDNSIRGRIASLLTSQKQSAPFNAAEEAALEGVAKGNLPRNAIRGVGNLLGGGGGLGAIASSSAGAGAAFATGSPSIAAAAIAPPVIGYAAKRIANALTDRELAAVGDLTRRRSPMYESMIADLPMEPVSDAKRAAIIRALLAGQQDPEAGR